MRHLLVSTGRDFFVELERTGVSLTQVKTLGLLAVRLAGVRGFVDELEPREREALAAGLDAVAGRFRR